MLTDLFDFYIQFLISDKDFDLNFNLWEWGKLDARFFGSNILVDLSSCLGFSDFKFSISWDNTSIYGVLVVCIYFNICDRYYFILL